MSRARVQLSREAIGAAALAIADTEGFQAVSMRRVAQELDVGTMSLYYYVKTKDDLVAAMDDALMSEALLPTVPKDWKRAITEIAMRTHSIFYVIHGLSFDAVGPSGINAMRHMEQCLEALTETSMTAKQKLTLLGIVDDFVFGHALRESTSEKVVDRIREAQIAKGSFPRIAEIFSGGRIDIAKSRFREGLHILLEAYGPRRPRV